MFRAVSICSSEGADAYLVMFCRMTFREVEMLADIEVDEDLLEAMIVFPSLMQSIQRVVSVCLKVGIVDEVQNSADRARYALAAV